MGVLPHQLLDRLDKAGFWSIDVWHFSFRSLPREYAWFFFLRAIVAHPVRTARGLRRYRRLVRERQDRTADYAPIMTIPGEATFMENVKAPGSRPLLGLGFCLKPIDPGNPLGSCPSGRANHDCLYLERGEARPACADCAIFEISRLAVGKGCPVYIMTSAKDIARDVMLPQIERDAFPSAILLLCPYSVQAIVPPLLICGIEALLISYSGGSCADYEQWLKADRGVKDERTELGAEARQKIRAVLSTLGGHTTSRRRFRREGNVFFAD